MLTLKIAFRNLLRHKRRSVLSGVTILFGYVLLSLSESLTAGNFSSITEIFTREDTGHVQIHRAGYLDRPTLNKVVADPERIGQVLSKVPGVLAFSPRVLGPALAYFGNKTAPVRVVGVDPEREPRATLFREKLRSGEMLKSAPDPQGRHGVWIGAGLVEILKAKLGDELVLISQGADGSVANERYVIVGVAGTPDSKERNTVFMSLGAAQAFYTLPDQVHEFVVMFPDFRRSETGARRIREQLKELGPAAASLSVEPWQVVEAEFQKLVNTKKNGNSVVYLIILFVVAIGVLNVILMSILERTREFGVLKAIGTRPSELFRSILLETALLGLVSIALGLLIALPLNYWFQETGILLPSPMDYGGVRLERLKGEVSLDTLLLPALEILGAAVLICFWPALRAARIRVVDALRSS